MLKAKARPITSITRPTLAVMASACHNGSVSEATESPAATVHPVSGDRVKAVSNGAPSSEMVSTFASR